MLARPECEKAQTSGLLQLGWIRFHISGFAEKTVEPFGDICLRHTAQCSDLFQAFSNVDIYGMGHELVTSGCLPTRDRRNRNSDQLTRFVHILHVNVALLYDLYNRNVLLITHGCL